jgi:polyphosphate:AMP phosphotransferase
MFEGAELGQKLDKQDYARREPDLRAALLDAQAEVEEKGDFSVVIVIAGAEGSGKGETVHRLLEWLDARGVDTHALGMPTEEEAERPRFYRFWRRLPRAGRTAIFFGSWYTVPIVNHALGQCDDADLERELLRIVEFERMLVSERTLVLKFWLHVTRKQQSRRFKKLASDPDTAWRVTDRDWEFHETYDEFVETAARALRRTSTAEAPWHVIEADDRRYRDMSVGEQILAAVRQRLDAPAPAAAPAAVPKPKKTSKNVVNSVDLSPRIDGDEYDKRLEQEQGRLGRLARRMSDSQCSSVLVFEGADAAGKGGCIRRAAAAIDPRFYRYVSVAAPSDEERARPYLWRFWRHLPARGHFTVFDRSWYGRVLVERVEGFATPAEWKRAYREINEFEEQMVDGGIVLAKFWLTISPEEQLRRFEERKKTAHKHYKLTPEDWRNREKWSAYETAASEMIERTSTEIAPWTLISAEDKRHARIRVLETICERLEERIGKDKKPKDRRKKHKK